MTGVNERVKEFLRSCRHLASTEIAICCHCGIELIDGNFALIEGELYCLKCRNIK